MNPRLILARGSEAAGGFVFVAGCGVLTALGRRRYVKLRNEQFGAILPFILDGNIREVAWLTGQ
jgi:hypothetical protein